MPQSIDRWPRRPGRTPCVHVPQRPQAHTAVVLAGRPPCPSDQGAEPMSEEKVELEEAAQAFADANASPPFTHELPIDQVRKAIIAMQSEPIDAPHADISDLMVPGPNGDVSIRVVRPPG